MKIRVPIAIAVLGALSLACGGLGGDEDEAAGPVAQQPAAEQPATPEPPAEKTETVSLVEPWSSMNLPLEGGTIAQVSQKKLVLRYSDAAWSEVGERFLSALTGAGWSKTQDDSIAEGMVVSLGKDGHTVKVEATNEGADAIVRLTTDLPAPDASPDDAAARRTGSTTHHDAFGDDSKRIRTSRQGSGGHTWEQALVEQPHAWEQALVEQPHTREQALVEQPHPAQVGARCGPPRGRPTPYRSASWIVSVRSVRALSASGGICSNEIATLRWPVSSASPTWRTRAVARCRRGSLPTWNSTRRTSSTSPGPGVSKRNPATLKFIRGSGSCQVPRSSGASLPLSQASTSTTVSGPRSTR